MDSGIIQDSQANKTADTALATLSTYKKMKRHVMTAATLRDNLVGSSAMSHVVVFLSPMFAVLDRV